MSEMFDKSQMSKTIDVPAGCTCVTAISQSHHMNSLIDIHTTHFSNHSRIHKKRTVWTSLYSHLVEMYELE